jgi:hypothetical protein
MTAKTQAERDSWFQAFTTARNSAQNPAALEQSWQTEAADCRQCIEDVIDADEDEPDEEESLSDDTERALIMSRVFVGFVGCFSGAMFRQIALSILIIRY